MIWSLAGLNAPLKTTQKHFKQEAQSSWEAQVEMFRFYLQLSKAVQYAADSNEENKYFYSMCSLFFRTKIAFTYTSWKINWDYVVCNSPHNINYTSYNYKLCSILVVLTYTLPMRHHLPQGAVYKREGSENWLKLKKFQEGESIYPSKYCVPET